MTCSKPGASRLPRGAASAQTTDQATTPLSSQGTTQTPRITARGLRGIPSEIAPYFDLEGHGEINDQAVADVVDYFDGAPPGDNNGVIDGREIEAVQNFVRQKQDIRLINAQTSHRLADRLRTKINCWATESQGDFDRAGRIRDRVERRYQDFSGNDALFSDTLFVASNLLLIVGFSRKWSVASVMIPYGIVEGARWIRGRDILADKEMRVESEVQQERASSDSKVAVAEIQKELLDLVDDVATSPTALRQLDSVLDQRLRRPVLPTEDEVYRDFLVLHARKNHRPIVGSEDNLRDSGRYYEAGDIWNPLRISGWAIAQELNKLPEATYRPVDTSAPADNAPASRATRRPRSVSGNSPGVQADSQSD